LVTRRDDSRLGARNDGGGLRRTHATVFMARTDTEPRTARGMRTALPWMPVEVRRRGEVVSVLRERVRSMDDSPRLALQQVERARKPRASVATTRRTRVPRRGHGIRATPSPVEIEPPASSPRAPASADGTIGRSLADERAFRGRKASKTVKRMRDGYARSRGARRDAYPSDARRCGRAEPRRRCRR
jgi:hypothetical protein